MSNNRKYKFLIADAVKNSPLREEMNQLYPAQYVLRFATERTLTINTAAVGGNADLSGMEH